MEVINASLATRSATLSVLDSVFLPLSCAEASPAVPNERTSPVAIAAATNFFFTFLLAINSNAFALDAPI